MSQPNMEDIIKSALEKSGTSEIEVSIWITELKALYDGVMKHQPELEAQLAQQIDEHSRTVENLRVAHRALEAERQKQVEQRSIFDQKLKQLEQLSNALIQERLNLAKTIKDFEKPDPIWGRIVDTAIGGVVALGIFGIALTLWPWVQRFGQWVGSLV